MNDWDYVVEGGQHILFRCADASSKGKLVRVSKDVLFLRRRLGGFFNTDATNRQDPTALRRQGLHKLLSPYVDLPECVDVCCNEEQLHQMVQRTLQAGKIPPHRIHDWSHCNGERQQKDEKTTLPCSLVRDYRQAPYSSDTDCWSIEVKPKAGYTAISPLVELHRTYKFQQSRCCLMASSRSGNGYYDPLDLFSGSHQRIVHAIHCLAGASATAAQQKPRNLLSVWRDGAKQSANDVSSWWISCTAKIFEHEPFLQRLQAVQQLDVIDADGALVLYRHVLNNNEWGDDEDPVGRLEALLDAPIELGLAASSQPLHPLLDNCPILLPTAPEDRSGLLQLCRLIASFREENLIDKATWTKLQRAHATARQQALALVANGQLTIPACCFLIQTWLLSLSMCDVSCFLTLWPVTAAKSRHDVSPCGPSQQRLVGTDDTTTASFDALVDHKKYQSSTSPGRIQVRRSQEDAELWEYEIKLIDFDPKPARKLRTRHEKEQLLDKWVLG